MVETTSITFQNRKLLRPSPEVNRVILGVLGRGLDLYPEVGLIAYQFLSTHATMNFVPLDHEVLSRFMEHFATNISKEVGTHLLGWTGAFWHQRYKPIAVIDGVSQERRFRYLVANCVKENLVEKCLDWPGVSSLRALLTGKPDVGAWYDRTAYYYAKRRKGGEQVSLEDFAIEYEVPLVRLPCWAYLSEEEYRERVRQVAIEVEEEAVAKREVEAKTILGVAAILAADPFERPEEVEKSPAPLVHAATRQAYSAFRRLFLNVVEAYQKASKAFRSGDYTVPFPEGTFRPFGGFVGWSESLAPI